jgi:hypothetical protein
MKQKNVALVLLSQGNVRSVVLVRKDAIEKNPELLDRLRAEAHRMYLQSVVIEEHPKQVAPKKLMQWLKDMNPQPDGVEMQPWEEAARWAISTAMDTLDWQRESGRVLVFTDHPAVMGARQVECCSLEELIRRLNDVSRKAWDKAVPVDGGGQAFRMEDEISIRDELFDRCEDQLRALGWK